LRYGLQLNRRLGPLPADGMFERADIAHQTVSVFAGQWESFSFVWQAKNDLPSGGLRIDFRPAYFREIIELRDVRIEALGPTAPARSQRSGFSYPGQEPDARWRAEADARIRLHRMAPLNVQVIDQWGQPVEGAEVHIEMQRHAYLFGTCVKASRITDAPIVPSQPDFDRQQFLADNQIYRQKLKELFNFAVFENDMKWPHWAGRRSNRGWSQAATMDAVDWLNDHDIVVKSHTMLWGSWQNVPKYLKAMEDDPAALRSLIHNHLRDQGNAFADHIQFADVLNEAMSHNELMELLGWDSVADWFKIARETLPGVQLVINEFDILGNGGSPKRQERHFALVEKLLAADAPIDVLGFQSHFWSTRLTPPEELFAIIDRFASFGLPLMVSEFDMNILDEDLQADYSRDFLHVWFSHPATESFIMWGFWAGAHWFGEPGAMFRMDWSSKPNLQSYTDLVFGDWWTNQTAQSDADGRVSERVFKGDYQITVSKPGYFTATRRPAIHDKGRSLQIILYPQSADY
jgi:GH35 family endo-1,4-beta-xylanase